MNKMPLDHLRSRKKPMTKTQWIAGDPELAQELLDSESELARCRNTLDVFYGGKQTGELVTQRIVALESEISTLTTKIDELRKQVRESSIKFVFKALKRSEKDAIAEDNPPTEAQKAEAKAAGAESDPPFNPDTYPLALVLASMQEPEFNRKDPDEYAAMAEWLESDSFNDNEFMALFMAAMQAQAERKIVELGKG